MKYSRIVDNSLRQDFFLCRVFSVKYVQNLKCQEWRTPQNRFVLGLLSGLYSLLPLKLCLAAEKRKTIKTSEL